MKLNRFYGYLFVIIGVFFLGAQLMGKSSFFNYSEGDYWPLIILTIGLAMEVFCLTTDRYQLLLIPSGIMVILGFLFLFEAATNFEFALYTWPVYIFSVAASIYQYNFLTSKKKNVFKAAILLGVIAFISEAILLLAAVLKVIQFGILMPVVLIITGIVIVINEQWNLKRMVVSGGK